MRKFLLYGLGVIFLSIPATAQNQYDILDPGNNVINGDTFVVTGPASASVIVEHFHLRNNTSQTKQISVKRYELNVQAGTQNYFCWSVCYLPVNAGTYPYFEDNGIIQVLGNTVEDTTLDCYYKPQNVVGDSYFRYVFFDRNNPSDTVFFDIKFSTWGNAINKNIDKNTVSIFPNPATSHLTVKAETPIKSYQIRNIVGQEIEKQTMVPSRQFNISISSLPEGIYFVLLTDERNNTNLRKIIKE